MKVPRAGPLEAFGPDADDLAKQGGKMRDGGMGKALCHLVPLYIEPRHWAIAYRVMFAVMSTFLTQEGCHIPKKTIYWPCIPRKDGESLTESFILLSLTCLVISNLRIRQDLGHFTVTAGVHLDF